MNYETAHTHTHTHTGNPLHKSLQLLPRSIHDSCVGMYNQALGMMAPCVCVCVCVCVCARSSDIRTLAVDKRNAP